MDNKKIEKVIVLFEEDVNCEIKGIGRLVFWNEGVSSSEYDISVEHIHDIELSMCSVSSSLPHQVLYHVDVIVRTNDNNIFCFEIINDDSILKIISWIKEHHIAYVDNLGIEDIFTHYSDKVQRWKYINRHFRSWAKKYHLDNPRDNHCRQYFKEIKEAIQETIQVLKK